MFVILDENISSVHVLNSSVISKRMVLDYIQMNRLMRKLFGVGFALSID